MLTTFSKSVLVPLILRLALAAIFIFHGLQKVNGENTQGGASWMAENNAQPAAVQLAVAWGELMGGIALACGFLTRLAAVGLIVIMAGAIATVHWPHFALKDNGFEYTFAIIMMCLCLVLGGSGPLAVDRVFRFKRREAA